MNKEIFISPCFVTINNKIFRCEYDHKSINFLEKYTEKGFYKLYADFIYSENLSKEDIINIISVAVLKYHDFSGMQEVKNALLENHKMYKDDLINLKLHFKQLLPDLTKFNRDMDIYIDRKKNSYSSPFYNFEEVYALALNCLGWSDTEFWNATPRKLCFALSAKSKYNEELEKRRERYMQKNSVNLLNGIKSIL